MANVIIIGNGISGVTTARYIRKHSDHSITIISKETEHFFSRTALMYVYMGHMTYENIKPYEDWFWEKNRIDLRKATVEQIDFEGKSLDLEGGEQLSYDYLVLALGSQSNKFDWPGQDLKGVQGMYSWQDLESMEERSKDLHHAVIIGGGLIGIEMAEMFHSRNIPVSLLVRESSYWNNVLPDEESQMVNRHIWEYGVNLMLESELSEIIGDEGGAVKGIRTKNGHEIACGFVGLAVGVHPNIAFLKGSPLETDRGILINDKQETNISGVYAVGDCAQHRNPPAGRAPVEQIWYTGGMQGKNCARNICGIDSHYRPGVFYNSAKFFDIEYQIYGQVPASEHEQLHSFFWQDAFGKKSIRLVYDKDKLEIKGFNLMGVRFRHEVCDKWIREKTSLSTVIQKLKAAYFDPEFSYESPVYFCELYKERFGETIVQDKKSSLKKLIFNLK